MRNQEVNVKHFLISYSLPVQSGGLIGYFRFVFFQFLIFNF